MDETAFWDVIEGARDRAAGDGDAQVQHLREALQRLPPTDIVAFDLLWYEQMRKSYSWDLWAAAYIINGGASDDGFEYFRCWLIGQGRTAFQEALRNPETLAKVAEGESENEALGYVASEAYEKVTGKKFPDVDRLPYPQEPTGTPWEEDSVRKRFPGLAARFN